MNTNAPSDIEKTCRFVRGTLIFLIFALYAIAFLISDEPLAQSAFYAAAAAALTVVFIKALMNC